MALVSIMQKAMEEQAAAERQRRATVTRAEGEKSAAILEADGRLEASKRVIVPIPLRPAKIASQVSGTVFPNGVTAPKPVMTTRLLPKTIAPQYRSGINGIVIIRW